MDCDLGVLAKYILSPLSCCGSGCFAFHSVLVLELGSEPRSLCLLGKHSITELNFQSQGLGCYQSTSRVLVIRLLIWVPHWMARF